MKYRVGFISNSSSSSFCILGVTTDQIEKQVEVKDSYYDYPIVFEHWVSEYEDGGAIGIYPQDMIQDKTVTQNKQDVANKINEQFGTTFGVNDISFITDGGYNG